MPLPFILIGGAAIAGAVGLGTGINGAVKMKDAKVTMEVAQRRHDRNTKQCEEENEITVNDMDKLGELELKICHSFEEFSKVFEQIKNKPNFKEYSKGGVTLPKYDGEKLKEVSIGAGILLGGIGGAGIGAAGGFAAAGATTAAVMALGTASTGTAIASLSGAALTNATLAALGGGAVAAGGGGMALGTLVLGGATLGIGLLVGGVIFSLTGGRLSDKADEAWNQMKEAEEKINKICDYLIDLRSTANKYYDTLTSVNKIYKKHLKELTKIVEVLDKKDWTLFTQEEKELTENTVLLVGLLYKMCKVKLVLEGEKEGLNRVNKEEVAVNIETANTLISDKF